MNQDTVDMFVRLQFMNDASISGLYTAMAKQPGGWVLKAIHKYFQASGLECDKRIEIMLVYLANGVIGHAVRYFADILKWAMDTGCKSVTWEDFARKIYPSEIPDYTKK